MFKSFSSLTEAAAAAAVSHNPLKPGTKSSRANKVSVHTHSSHSRYRPTTLLLCCQSAFQCQSLCQSIWQLAGRQTLSVFSTCPKVSPILSKGSDQFFALNFQFGWSKRSREAVSTSDRPKGPKVIISFCSFNESSVWPFEHYKKIHFYLIGLIFKCNQSVFQQAVGVYCWTGCRQRKNMAPKPKTRRAAKPIRAACVSSYSIGFLPLLLSDSWHLYPLKYTNGQVSAPSNHGKSLV